MEYTFSICVLSVNISFAVSVVLLPSLSYTYIVSIHISVFINPHCSTKTWGNGDVLICCVVFLQVKSVPAKKSIFAQKIAAKRAAKGDWTPHIAVQQSNSRQVNSCTSEVQIHEEIAGECYDGLGKP